MRRSSPAAMGWAGSEQLEQRLLLHAGHVHVDHGVMIVGGQAVGDEHYFPDGPAITSEAQGSSSWTIGVKSVLILRATFSDSPTSDPQSAASVMSMMGQVDQFIQANSFGLTSMVTTVTDLLVLPNNEQFYITSGTATLQAEARAAATTANPAWNYLNFDLDAIRYNGGPGNFAGAATVGQRGCWLKNSSAGVAVHEFGHNFGLSHSNYWDPSADETIIGPGENEEYGDPYST
ncbi:MAG: zinc-dependent metalloprotease family protein, partial [Tepidisphaeraceae bacterium]